MNDKKLSEKELKEYNWKVRRKKWLYIYFNYKTKKDRGGYWMSLLEQYIPITKGLDFFWTFIALKIAIQQDSEFWAVIGIGIYVAYRIFMEILLWLLGNFDHKKGLWREELDWSPKNKQYNVFNIQLMEQLKAIGKVLNIESHFTDIEETLKKHKNEKV